MPRISLRPGFEAGPFPNFGRATLINMHAERSNERGVFPVVGQFGTELKTTLKAPGRGQFVHLGVHYAVGGDTLYTINSDWGATAIGTIAGTYPVRFAANASQIAFLGRPNLYTMALGSGEISLVDDPDFPGATDICCVNGVGVFLQVNSDRWGTTRVQDFRQVDALDIATAESSADPLTGCIIVKNQLALFGTESIELWANTGNGNPPFDRAYVADAGCLAADTIKLFDGYVVWLGKTRSGGVTVMRSTGGDPQRFATHAVERLLESASDLSMSRAFTYVRDGHEFYELVTDAGSVRMDAATGLWTQTASGTWPAGAEPPASRFLNAVTRDGEVVFQDASGSLYVASKTLYQDAGNPLIRAIRTPVVAGNGKRITLHRVEIEFEAGKAVLGETPKISMSISRDGGHTWRDCGTRSAGVTGDYGRRAEWRRLGQVENAMLEFRFAENAPFNVQGVFADIEEDRRS